ncbi:uncharacterized protein LOC127080469 [Lathyrus oleraceus]|uniref:uncharacterized protein LOC127080469 n=1 Tax=Pisum sativum TaxID=3888 RepID=UPI0021D2F5C1|nr:uncharacterized protein LOC127080469 [Pisum sativum]
MEDVTVDTGRPLNAHNLKSMGVIEQIRVKPSLDTSWEALKDQRKIPNGLYLFSKIDPPEVATHYLQDLARQGVDISEFSVDWLPEHPPNFMKRQREPSGNLKKAKKAKLGETSISRPLVPLIESPSKSPPPPSRPAHTLASQQQPEPEANTHTPPEQPIPPPSKQPQIPTPEQPTTTPSEQPPTPPLEQQTTPPSETPIVPPFKHITIPTSQPPADTTQTPPESPSPNSKPEPIFPTLEEAISLFVESSVEKIKPLSENSGISGDPSAVRIHWNKVIRCMTSEAFKLKSLSEQVRNDFIREAGERLQARLFREAEEKARREGEEKARVEEEQMVREATKKVAAKAAAAEAEAKVKADAEEAAHIAVEEAAKASNDALAQGEQSNSDFPPLVLKTLEELQKEQQIDNN